MSNFSPHFIQKTRFVDLYPEQSDEVQRRSPSGTFSPLGQGHKVVGAPWSKGLQPGKEQQTVRSYSESRMARYGLSGPDLSLPHSQGVLFFPMIDFNLPAIKIGLEHDSCRAFHIRAEQIGWLAIVGPGIGRESYRVGGQQPGGEVLRIPAPLCQSTPLTSL